MNTKTLGVIAGVIVLGVIGYLVYMYMIMPSAKM